MKNEPERIMSGDYSKDMWDAINGAKTVAELRQALYFVCCRLQELESRLTKRPADGETASLAWQPVCTLCGKPWQECSCLRRR
jgi:hypothetical protein